MLRAFKGTGGAIAAVSLASVTGAAVIVLSATLVGDRLVAMQQAKAASLQDGGNRHGADVATINREAKGDRLPISDAPQTRAEIATVEVVGVRDASIVYRDRHGNVLYQTDPLANVTIVTKNVELPEVTIRESGETQVKRMPAEEAAPSDPPHGCESAFARPSPESLTRTPSRCVTEQATPHRHFAALR